MVPLLPKLRGHFAEFLNHSYPERLSIFNLTTCVGLGYGPYTHIARGFSRQYRITNFTNKGSASRLNHMSDGFTYHSAYTLTPTIHSVAWLPPCVTPSLGPHIRPHARTQHSCPKAQVPCLWVVSINALPRARIYGYQNINWLSIDYACRPRLRSRLTLGRRT